MKRTININQDSYKIISAFCKKNTLVMNAWAEKILLETIKKIESYEETNK